MPLLDSRTSISRWTPHLGRLHSGFLRPQHLPGEAATSRRGPALAVQQAVRRRRRVPRRTNAVLRRRRGKARLRAYAGGRAGLVHGVAANRSVGMVAPLLDLSGRRDNGGRMIAASGDPTHSRQGRSLPINAHLDRGGRLKLAGRSGELRQTDPDPCVHFVLEPQVATGVRTSSWCLYHALTHAARLSETGADKPSVLCFM